MQLKKLENLKSTGVREQEWDRECLNWICENLGSTSYAVDSKNWITGCFSM